MVLSPELRAWLVPGRAGMIATVDRQGQPQVTRAWTVRMLEAPDTIEVYVHHSASLALLESLANGGRAALNLIEVSNYRSRMFKGACEFSPIPTDLGFLEQNLAALDAAFSSVGMPAETTQRILSHSDQPRSMVALRLNVDSVFDQSPKPGAAAVP